MNIELLDQYDHEVEVEYKGEHYLVRDNGAVCRMQKPGSRRRPLDGKWTFGNKSSNKGYMQVSSHVVHRIIAFAFLGSPPTEAHVVDHIDTNKRNNRSENLRWVTRLENIMLNPITLKRVIIGWGSLKNFFNNPHKAPRMEPSIDWMRTVSKEEAAECLEQLLKWAESDKLPKGGELGEWIYGVQNPSPPITVQPQDIQSLTPLAFQRNWKTPAEFPYCPEEVSEYSLATYYRVLEVDSVFSMNVYSESVVVKVEQGDSLLSVLTAFREESVKPWAVTKVTIVDGKFIHESMGSFFDYDGARKEHSKLLGIELDIESFDDYC